MDAKTVKREQARELARQGMSYNKITKELNVAKSSVSNWCRDIVNEMSPEQLAEKLKRDRVVNIQSKNIARERYLKGDRTKTIAGDLNVNVATVVRWCRDLTRPKSVKAKMKKPRTSKAEFGRFPYDKYRIYHSKRKDNLDTVSLVHDETLVSTSMSLARYLMSVKEGRVLRADEFVIHIDGPEDVVSNLKITTREQQRLDFIERAKKICPVCEEYFVPKRSAQKVCSTSCGNKIRHRNRSSPDLALKERDCRGCGTTFKSPNSSVRYCSDDCREKNQKPRIRTKSTAPRKQKPQLAKVECVVCERKFIPNAPERDYCYSAYCVSIIENEAEE